MRVFGWDEGLCLLGIGFKFGCNVSFQDLRWCTDVEA